MTTKDYIVAIEIGSSKISGAIGIHTYSGIKILAYASEQVNGFITKGVVRNVDETGNCLTSLINRLWAQLDNVIVEKAYIAFGGFSMHSHTSTVIKEFKEYTKITNDIIDEMALENDNKYNTPAGYQKVQTIPLECKLNGDINIMPIGIPTCKIECKFLNIIMREQYMKQLDESFEMANIKIADSFNAIKIEAEELLNEEEMGNGTAFVNIGAETTGIAIYSNKLLRMLTMIPLGSHNITKDLCSEQLSQIEAEQMKIFKGYHSEGNDNSALPTELVDQIISARMSEILHNVKHQIEVSGENVRKIVFTGGGAKLKNIELIIEEVLPNFKTRIATDHEFTYFTDEKLELTKGAITPILYGLLKRGKENCCKEEIITPADATIPDDLFGGMPIEESSTTISRETTTESDRQVAHTQEFESKGEAREENKTEDTKKTKKEKNKGGGLYERLFGRFKEVGADFIESITEEEQEDKHKEKYL